jgi:pantetheine-phosphate adenylyltransferase
MPKTTTAVYPGSFDPVTNGHLDVLERAARVFGRLIVMVATNEQKEALFSVEERLKMIRDSVGHLGNVEVDAYDGLLVDYCRDQGASVIVRGLRAVSDFEFEFQMALMNRKLAPAIETFFLMPDEAYTYLSSRIIREIARLGGDIGPFVPESVVPLLTERIQRASC